MAETTTLTVGAKVRVERDETAHPSKGTWPQFRGRRGTVIGINPGRTFQNRIDDPTDTEPLTRGQQRRKIDGPVVTIATEYAVVFGNVSPEIRDGQETGRLVGGMPTWFKRYELTVI